MIKFICQKCELEYPHEGLDYRCRCGGLFRVEFNCTTIDFNALDVKEHSLWRYIDTMPFLKPETISMGEGFTPLIPLNPKSRNLLTKCEYYMPTLSFKDRGAAVLITVAKGFGIKNVICDSSGNAGASIAAYSARAGIVCDVFVPMGVSAKKLQQIEAYGANLHKIPGNREDATNAAICAVEESGAFYASHIFNPLFYEGIKTYYFEVYEQLGKMPDCFIVPAGNGTLLMGARRAFTQMLEWGVITKMPRLLAVQHENCAPIYQAWKKGESVVSKVIKKSMLAEGIAMAAPIRGEDILATLRLTDGDVITVTDEEILKARQEMSLVGIYTEWTDAATYAGYNKFVKKYPCIAEQTIVMPLCGTGIKSN